MGIKERLKRLFKNQNGFFNPSKTNNNVKSGKSVFELFVRKDVWSRLAEIHRLLKDTDIPPEWHWHRDQLTRLAQVVKQLQTIEKMIAHKHEFLQDIAEKIEGVCDGLEKTLAHMLKPHFMQKSEQQTYADDVMKMVEQLETMVANEIMQARNVEAQVAAAGMSRRSFLSTTARAAGYATASYAAGPLVNATMAYAEDRVWIGDVYEQAIPVDDPNMPKGLRWFQWGTYGRGVTFGTRARELPENFVNGYWSKLYFGKEYGTKIQNIFTKHGFDVDKISYLFKSLKKEKLVALYRDGTLLIKDAGKNITYLLPVGKTCIQDILNL